MSSLRFVSFGLLSLLIVAPSTYAQSFESRHQRELSANPSDLHFHLETTGGARNFHRGERIPLTLEFWSDSPDKYKLNGATYDRSGRLPTEEFVRFLAGPARGNVLGTQTFRDRAIHDHRAVLAGQMPFRTELMFLS